jgi:hypothetical protein
LSKHNENKGGWPEGKEVEVIAEAVVEEEAHPEVAEHQEDEEEEPKGVRRPSW